MQEGKDCEQFCLWVTVVCSHVPPKCMHVHEHAHKSKSNSGAYQELPDEAFWARPGDLQTHLT